jgi:hypothetical protein
LKRLPRLPLHLVTLLACSGACSLRSLDYLESGEASAGAEATAGSGTTESGGSSGALSTGGGAGAGKSGAGGSDGGRAGASASGGTGTAGAMSSGGASGSGSSGGAGSGGSVDPSGGTGGSEGGTDSGGAGGEDGGTGEAGAPTCTPGELGCPPVPVVEIPYVVRPGHAPEKCADIQNFSIVNGGAAVQYTCHQQINQVFWAEEHAGGHLAFRNAFSGKCLEVADASVAPDARVQQAPCTGNADQLFLPEPADNGLVKLVVQHSGLLLDVAGDAPTEDVRLLVQNPDTGAADQTWELEPTDLGAFVTLEPSDRDGRFLRHDGESVFMEASAEGSSEWKIVSGLANNDCVSFVSRDDVGRYLRHDASTLYREEHDGSNRFALDATFCFRYPLEGSGYASFSLESENYPGYYVIRIDDNVALEQSDGTVEFETAATWHFGQIWH